MVTLPSMLQAPIQALLRPAMWMPGIRNIHSHSETWESDKPPEEVLTALVRAIEHIRQRDDTGAYYDIHKVNKEKLFLRVFCFTKAEWLDVVEITVKGDCIQAKSFSSGFLPLFIPFAFIINCVFFWFPFYDNKLNKARLELIKHYTDIAITGQQKVNDVNEEREHDGSPNSDTRQGNTKPDNDIIENTDEGCNEDQSPDIMTDLQTVDTEHENKTTN